MVSQFWEIEWIPTSLSFQWLISLPKYERKCITRTLLETVSNKLNRDNLSGSSPERKMGGIKHLLKGLPSSKYHQCGQTTTTKNVSLRFCPTATLKKCWLFFFLFLQKLSLSFFLLTQIGLQEFNETFTRFRV